MINNAACRLVGAEFPLFAFSHCRDVVAAVSRAGGFGVLGGSSHTPEQLELELHWIDEHVDGRPYGIDILIPEHMATGRGATLETLAAMVPQAQRQFAADVLKQHGIEAKSDDFAPDRLPSVLPEFGEALMDVAFKHPIRLIANALGIAPPSMIERARKHGVPVAALVGAKEHALRQVKAGVDLIVAQGGEAGGHCGEVSTLVLVPEVIRAVRQVRDVPVLAAGGIVTGAQMAACMAMGAAGVWTGSVWLTTSESEVSQVIREKFIAASSRDTVRSRARTGKPARQLRSPWHDAWNGDKSPGCLPLPLMTYISQPAFEKIDRAANRGEPGGHELASYFVGQGVGLIESVQSAASVVHDFMTDFSEAFVNLQRQIEE